MQITQALVFHEGDAQITATVTVSGTPGSDEYQECYTIKVESRGQTFEFSSCHAEMQDEDHMALWLEHEITRRLHPGKVIVDGSHLIN